MEVTPDEIGRIIGSGGATIKQIRASSGARINTDRTYGLTQPIHFEGTEAQVEIAIAMVREAMSIPQNSRRGDQVAGELSSRSEEDALKRKRELDDHEPSDVVKMPRSQEQLESKPI